MYIILNIIPALIFISLIYIYTKYRYFIFYTFNSSIYNEHNLETEMKWLSDNISNSSLLKLFQMLIQFNYYHIDIPRLRKFINHHNNESSYQLKSLEHHTYELLFLKPKYNNITTLKNIKKISLILFLIYLYQFFLFSFLNI